MYSKILHSSCEVTRTTCLAYIKVRFRIVSHSSLSNFPRRSCLSLRMRGIYPSSLILPHPFIHPSFFVLTQRFFSWKSCLRLFCTSTRPVHAERYCENTDLQGGATTPFLENSSENWYLFFWKYSKLQWFNWWEAYLMKSSNIFLKNNRKYLLNLKCQSFILCM